MHKAVGLWNLLSHAGRDVSPLEALTSTRQSVAHLRPIGCRAFVLKNERELGASTTFSERAWAGINLGNVRGGPAYMIYVAELGEIKFSTNVDFAVQVFPFAAPEETQHPLDDGIYYYDSPPPGFAMDAPPGRAAPAPDGSGNLAKRPSAATSRACSLRASTPTPVARCAPAPRPSARPTTWAATGVRTWP